jgi:hypothetical protein
MIDQRLFMADPRAVDIAVGEGASLAHPNDAATCLVPPRGSPLVPAITGERRADI